MGRPAAVRHQGATRLSDVEPAVVEPSAALTVELNDPIGEVLERLRRIEARLGSSGGRRAGAT